MSEEQENDIPVYSDYYLDWHVLSKVEAIIAKAKNSIQFSKVKDEQTYQDLRNDVLGVYQILELLYPRESFQQKG